MIYGRCKICRPVLFKHDDGWDIYSARDCYEVGGELIPRWFDRPLVQDAPTKAAAIAEWKEMHTRVLGLDFCHYGSWLREGSRVASHSCDNPLCSGDGRIIGFDRAAGGDRNAVLRLADAILGPDEHLVVPMGGDPSLFYVVKDGRFWSGTARFEQGRPNGCHANSARLWEQGRGDIATGYALGPGDGYWRSHSWVVAPDGLIETTVPRDRYYGCVLNDGQAAAFAAANG